MKIVMVSECLGGGVLTYVQTQANFMAQEGHDIVLIYSRREQTPPPDTLRAMFDSHVRMIEVEFKRSSVWSFVRYSRELRRLVDKEQPDVVHYHSSFAGLFGRMAVNTKGISSYYTPHGYAFLQIVKSKLARKIYFLMERAAVLMDRSTVIIPISASEEAAALDVSLKAAIVKVDTGIDIELLEAKRAGIDSQVRAASRKQIVSCGRLSQQKNPLLFVEVAKECVKRGVDADFLWIGGGELEGEVRAKMAEYGLEDRIRITGWVKHDEAIREMDLHTDIYLQTSLWEGLPITVLEAMYLETCVIVNKAPGNVDPIEHGRNGFIVSDAAEFADVIEFVLNEPARREAIKCYARQHIEENFNMKHNTRKMLQKYTDDLRQSASEKLALSVTR
ncbi:glycosyltransferase [Paenibacillus gansuensis]|uniref:Glycosyltransferase n=1 Tax=Paenibacillus gansuensis TaxID=306542 RepID=A0ABW5P720_9BACL